MKMTCKNELKALLRRIKSVGDVEKIKPEIKEALSKLDPAELALAEQELMAEGISVEEIRKLCEPHLELLREGIIKRRQTLDPSHPIQILREEHEVILQKIEELRRILEKPAKNYDEHELNKLKDIVHHLIEAESHHKREEEALFPELERKGITGPPKVMQMEHEELRAHKKALKELLETHKKLSYKNFLSTLKEHGSYIVQNLDSHIFKENNILYPTALRTIEGETWTKIKKKFDEIGYCCFTPKEK
ncbi:MAG: DUF438 domain-containing protein [Candidatus Bathyarchaeia archaeon]